MSTKTDAYKRTSRVPIMLREDEVKAVDGFRFANRCSSRSEAIRTLMKSGLKVAAQEKDDTDAR